MKRNNAIIALLIASIFGATLAVTNSLAWMTSNAYMERSHNPIEGVVEDEYYASGTGIEGDPFIITKPRHLYNLAWLQLLGFYNKNTGTDNHQFYFELGDNIDMTEYCAIPPIGTELNPFVGNFDGKGYVITGVTISNDFSDYTLHPSVISGWDNSTRKQPHILGLFGVVGEYQNCNKPTECSSVVNQFVNTGITGANIKTVVLDSLVGVAAGYVKDAVVADTHNMLKNIVVDNSTITLPTTGMTANYGTFANISDYALVGYTNATSGVVKASKSTYGINMDTNIVYAASEDGNTTGWGGSVNMLEMYNHLHNIWTKFNSTHTSGGTNPFQYYSTKEISIDLEGEVTVDNEGGLANNRLYGTEDGTFDTSYNYNHAYYGYKYNDSSDSNKETASYTFVIEESSGDENYMQLTGKKEVTIPNGQSLTTHYYDSYYGRKIYIDINTDRYYLTRNGTNDVTVTDSEANASWWNIADDGTIYTFYNNTIYYLNRNATTSVNLGTNSTTTWTYDATNSGYYTIYNGEAYYLNCTTTDWNISQGTASYYLLSDGNGHYITHPSTNGNSGTGTNPNATEARWYRTNDGYYRTGDGTGSYLRSNYSSRVNNNSTSTQNMYVSNSTTRAFTINGDGYLYTTYYSTRNHYVYGYFNGTNWVETIATGNANPPANRTVVQVDGVFTPEDSAKNISLSAPDSTKTNVPRTKTETVDTSIETYHTYFPLRQLDGHAGVPDDTNTGYVVSGANYWGDPYGDIRVSKYAKNTYLPNGVDTVYTINASGNRETVSAANFKKYDAAKAAMQTVLNSDSNIYGLHFMNANISYGGDNPVIAPKVVVNGDTYYDYELPSDCVDFHLKEKGFVNFFAGTYYSGNDCCFSLHEVFRDGQDIETIKEITEIYADPTDTTDVKSYVYKYSDNKYSIPFRYSDGEKINLDGTPYVENSVSNTKPSAYSTLAFATSRIKYDSDFSNNSNRAFYFEIPMHEGEYCLGSVPGHNGAYLMYLDIAANASKTNRTIFYEKFTVNETIYSHPVGVSLNDLPSAPTTHEPVINIAVVMDDSDSACMRIQPTSNGAYTIDRNSTDVTLSRANTTMAPPVYCSDTIELIHDSGSSTPLAVTAVSSTSYMIKQMEIYDYSIIADTLTVTTIRDSSTDEGDTYTRTVKQVKYGGDDPTTTPKSTYVYDPSKDLDQRSEMKVYNHLNNGAKLSVGDLIDTTVFSIPEAKLSNTEILEFRLFQAGGDTYDDEFTVIVVSDTSHATDGTFYTYNGMVITITPESGTITIKVDGTSYVGNLSITVYDITRGTSATLQVATSMTFNGTVINGTNQTIVIETPNP